jgi:hypothetical protein
MASHGPQELQRDIHEGFTAFFNEIADSPFVTNDHQITFLRSMESILKLSDDGYALTFDEKIQVKGMPFSAAELIELHNLAVLRNGLSALARQYKVSFTQALPLQSRAEPAELKQVGEDLRDEQTGALHILKRKLEGRGQPGLACFYLGQDGQERLIKEDEVQTCLMEGTAYYIKEMGLLPGKLASSVNFAKVGTLIKKDQKMPVIVSIQDKVISTDPTGSIRSWDELVFGAKRQPKTLISSEQWNEGAILENILLLSTDPKWQLAAGIMSSAIVGDESLHVGQFMALVDAENHIVGIKRIDLGARERYALARNATNQQDPYNVSSQYKSTGQFGKNYISYLLAEPSLRKMYTMLWVNLSSVDKLQESMVNEGKQAFMKQFAIVPQQMQQQALEGVLDTLNKSAKTPFVPAGNSVQEKAEATATYLAKLDAIRVMNMISSGKREYAEYQKQMTERITASMPFEQQQFCLDAIKLQDKLVLARNISPDDQLEVLEKINTLNKWVEELVLQARDNADLEVIKKIRLLTDFGADLVQAATLNLQYSPTKLHELNVPINEHLNKLQTLNELAVYCENSSTPDKKSKAVMMMKLAIQSDESLIKYIQNPELIDKMKAHQSHIGATSSLIVGTHARGELLMMRLFKRYHLNDKLLMMSESQHKLIEDIQAQNFAKVAIDIQSFSIYDVLQPIQNGKTALHCLMELGGADPDSLNAIADIFRKVVGKGIGARSDLDIPDAKGLTPFDYLMQNPNAPAIIKHINNLQIKESISPWANYLTVDNFFNVSKYQEALQARYIEIVPSASSKLLKIKLNN